MRCVSRPILIVFLVLLGRGGVAAADEGGLTASVDSPVAGLPAVSADARWFARPLTVHAAGCRGPSLFVELGAVGGPRGVGRSEMLLVRDECDRTASWLIVRRNIARLDAALRSERFRAVGTTVSRTLPATVEIDGDQAAIEVGKSGRDLVVTRGTDRWNVALDGQVGELRGWYAGKNPAGQRYFALQVSSFPRDVGERGRERWIEFYPVETAGGGVASAPIEVADRWLRAMRTGDTATLRAMIAVPFFKQGLNPVGEKRCRKRTWQKARTRAQVARVARCIVAGTSQLYSNFAAEDRLVEIDMREFPDELNKHRARVDRLVDAGAKLVRYHVNDDDLYVFLILVLDPADPTRVRAALESLDVMTE